MCNVIVKKKQHLIYELVFCCTVRGGSNVMDVLLQLVSSGLFKTTAELSSWEVWSEQTRQPHKVKQDRGQRENCHCSCFSAKLLEHLETLQALAALFQDPPVPASLIMLQVQWWEDFSRNLISSKIFFFRLSCLSPNMRHLLSRQLLFYSRALHGFIAKIVLTLLR